MRLRRPTYTAIAATVALVLSMSGGALAASHYLITSTKQISPNVLKKLKGNRGPAGRRGPAGPQGPQGPQGVAGTNGTNGANGATLGLNDFKDLVNLPAHTGDQTVATLPNVPAGSYILTAKLTFITSATGASPCDLRAGGDFDESPWVGSLDGVTLPFTLSHTFTAPGSVTLTCDDANTAATVRFAKISAVQVQNLVRSSQ
jgi:hypothetical protein